MGGDGDNFLPACCVASDSNRHLVAESTAARTFVFRGAHAIVHKVGVVVVMLACLVVSLPAPVTAATPLDLAALAAPHFDNFRSHDGLPQAAIVAIETDAEGFVWAGSSDGLYRYDGRSWQKWQGSVATHAVTDLLLADDDRLWAAMGQHGLAVFEDGSWHIAAAGASVGRVTDIIQTRDAAGMPDLWALSSDLGVLAWRKDQWSALDDQPGPDGREVLSLAASTGIGGKSRLWAGTASHGLWYRDADSTVWHHWDTPGLDTAQIEDLLVAGQGQNQALWIAAFGYGLLRLDDNGLKKWSQVSGALPSNSLYALASTHTSDGRDVIWVASGKGLVRVMAGHVRTFDTHHGLSSAALRTISAWRSPGGQQVLWLGCKLGVSRSVIGSGTWSTVSLLGAGGLGVFGVLTEADGHDGTRLWVGSWGEGLALYENGTWQHFTKADSALPGDNISMIRALPATDTQPRTRWLGTWGGQLVRIEDGPTFSVVPTPWPKMNGQAVEDVVRYAGDLWVATRLSGAWRLHHGQWQAMRPPAIKGQWRVYRFARQTGPNGEAWLWAATFRGLARFHAGQWAMFGPDAGFPAARLLGVTLMDDINGKPVLWLGSTDHGIVRVDVSDPTTPRLLPDSLPDTPSPAVYGAWQAPNGVIYVCTNSGVQQLVPQADGEFSARMFDRRDGMVSNECNVNSQWIDAAGRFWTGTLGGLTVHDPAQTRPDHEAKPLRVTGLYIDGKRQSGPLALRVPAGPHSLRVTFALLSWKRGIASRFRTTLVGLDKRPGPWTAESSRSFTGLPPGDYDLRIEARDYAGNLSHPIEIPIHVAAQWWQTRWAFALGMLLLLLTGYLAARTRNHLLRRRQHELERHVAERTAELDAANRRLQKLSYHDPLTGLPNRRRMHEAMDAAHGRRMAVIYIDIDHFKDLNDRYGHSAGDEVLQRVVTVISTCLPEDSLLARHGGEEFICLLPDTDLATATQLAEKLRSTLAGTPVAIPGGPADARITISAGVALRTLHDAEDARRLLRDADRAMYLAKDEGRNRVSLPPPAAPAGESDAEP